MTDADIAHVLVALSVLLVVAHAFGQVFARLRQPPVIGEIIGGLLLGPTILGLLLPTQQAALFPDEGATAVVLSAVYQLGLLLLMFAAGAEVRSVFHPRERRTAVAIATSGMVFPFVAAVLFLQLIEADALYGEAKHPTAFVLVFAIGIAVTSIPVISRIMFDLGVISTPFARVVLTAAIIEDVVLYVLLAIALGLVHAEQGQGFGLAAELGVSDGAVGAAYHVAAAVAFFLVLLAFGSRLLRAVLRSRFEPVVLASPIAFELTVLFTVTAASLFLGVSGFLGAFVAGIITTSVSDDPTRSRAAIRNFSFAFFIPVYFAIVGMRLDLVHAFDLAFFLIFLTFACGAKALSVYVGARLVGESRFASTNLAVAMNARGGPGIVLATVAYDAAIINEEFYSALVLLVIVTSLAAGTWLERALRSGRPLLDVSERPESAPATTEAPSRTSA